MAQGDGQEMETEMNLNPSDPVCHRSKKDKREECQNPLCVSPTSEDSESHRHNHNTPGEGEGDHGSESQETGVGSFVCFENGIGFGCGNSYETPTYPELPTRDNSEWQYVMRRTMQEIVPGVFLGPYASATRAKLDDLKFNGITHIVCIREPLERNLIRPNHVDHFTYLVVEIADSTTANIIPHFRIVNEFIGLALSTGGKALIHGNAGISRSATLVIAFIMEKFGVTTKEAYTYVQGKRFCSNPNEGFIAQLREYEPIYRALHVVPLELPGTPRTSSKRSLEDDIDNMDNMSMETATSSAEFPSTFNF